MLNGHFTFQNVSPLFLLFLWYLLAVRDKKNEEKCCQCFGQGIPLEQCIPKISAPWLCLGYCLFQEHPAPGLSPFPQVFRVPLECKFSASHHLRTNLKSVFWQSIAFRPRHFAWQANIQICIKAQLRLFNQRLCRILGFFCHQSASGCCRKWVRCTALGTQSMRNSCIICLVLVLPHRHRLRRCCTLDVSYCRIQNTSLIVADMINLLFGQLLTPDYHQFSIYKFLWTVLANNFWEEILRKITFS